MTYLNNFILRTDSYKMTHWRDVPQGTQAASSYLEAREGAEFDFTLFVGLQYIIQQYLTGVVVTQSDVDQAAVLAGAHFGDPTLFNRAGWELIVNEFGGKLPLRIKAVPEGTKVPIGNALMVVESTDDRCAWLVQDVESLLLHVWYPTTVATLSKAVKNDMEAFLGRTGDPANIDFMLHDFGYRGATTDEAAAVGGMAHIVNFMGTDTLLGMACALDHYEADLNTLAFSVVATEHSVMTALGRDGEFVILDRLLADHPTGILSVVADSFDIYEFVRQVNERRDVIMAREGRFVLRPDSVTSKHRSEEELLLWILEALWETYGGEVNSKGFKVLDTHIRVLWGDGIDRRSIHAILSYLEANGFSADNFVFGMGGGLLQKVNRDTQRFAIKSSAQMRDGVWYDVKKETPGKNSKAGRLKLVRSEQGVSTVRVEEPGEDLLQTVFLNGAQLNKTTFDEVRGRARE